MFVENKIDIKNIHLGKLACVAIIPRFRNVIQSPKKLCIFIVQYFLAFLPPILQIFRHLRDLTKIVIPWNTQKIANLFVGKIILIVNRPV